MLNYQRVIHITPPWISWLKPPIFPGELELNDQELRQQELRRKRRAERALLESPVSPGTCWAAEKMRISRKNMWQLSEFHHVSPVKLGVSSVKNGNGNFTKKHDNLTRDSSSFAEKNRNFADKNDLFSLQRKRIELMPYT